MRPIVWVSQGRIAWHGTLHPPLLAEKQENSSLCISIQMRFGSVERPMLNNRQILLPMQAQQLGRSYNGRLLVHVEINVKQTVNGEVVHQYSADIQDLCVGEVPVLVDWGPKSQVPRDPRRRTPCCATARVRSPRPASSSSTDSARSLSPDRGPFSLSKKKRRSRAVQERLANNHPLVSVCVLQTRFDTAVVARFFFSCSVHGTTAGHTQYSCEVRSVPLNNPHRYPVVFTVRVNQSPQAVHCPPRTMDTPVLLDPIIVTLTYFRHKQTPIMYVYGVGVWKRRASRTPSPSQERERERGCPPPVTLLFLAYGYTNLDHVCGMIAQTARWSPDVIRELLYATSQHTAAIRNPQDALQILASFIQPGTASATARSSTSGGAAGGGGSIAAAEELLYANVLPHLSGSEAKMQFLTHGSRPPSAHGAHRRARSPWSASC